jgi:hypothetical protein
MNDFSFRKCPSYKYLLQLLEYRSIEGGGAHPSSYNALQILLEHQNLLGYFGDLLEVGVLRGHTLALRVTALPA